MSRPNILFISAEQQRGDTMRCTGADWMRTPHLDRLAERSAIFANALCRPCAIRRPHGVEGSKEESPWPLSFNQTDRGGI